MKAEVGIAEKLSEYLRAVRKGGEVVTKDRETPIARLVPFEKARPRLETIPPAMSLKEMDKLPFFRPKGLRPGDLEEALREERKDRFGRFSTSPDFSSVARS
jgi:antitoxin (DNA-binding transcriptional repressor) of toxin-antitoxin stability system